MTEQLSIYEQAYDEGYNAFMNGLCDEDDNPYDYEECNKRAVGWVEGYRDAEADNLEG